MKSNLYGSVLLALHIKIQLCGFWGASTCMKVAGNADNTKLWAMTVVFPSKSHKFPSKGVYKMNFLPKILKYLFMRFIVQNQIIPNS